MKQSRLSKDILTVAVLTSITVFTWIILDVYHTLKRPEVPNVPAEQLAPLDPKINAQILDKLNQRQVFDKEQYIRPVSTESAKTNL